MTVLDIFALFILLVLLITIVAVWGALGYYPGKIAQDRNHPQQEAINICGWLGALSLGLLCPLAFIWAFTNPRWKEQESTGDSANDQETTQ